MNVKQIKYVDIGLMCMETRICKHNITIIYFDSTKEKYDYVGAQTIVENYWEYLSNRDKNHFLKQDYDFVKKYKV